MAAIVFECKLLVDIVTFLFIDEIDFILHFD